MEESEVSGRVAFGWELVVKLVETCRRLTPDDADEKSGQGGEAVERGQCGGCVHVRVSRRNFPRRSSFGFEWKNRFHARRFGSLRAVVFLPARLPRLLTVAAEAVCREASG